MTFASCTADTQLICIVAMLTVIISSQYELQATELQAIDVPPAPADTTVISSPSQAQAEGFFAEQGLTVCYNQVLSSPAQFAALYAGTYQIISTTTGKHTSLASPRLYGTWPTTLDLHD